LSEFNYEKLFQYGADKTNYRQLDLGPIKKTNINGKNILHISSDIIENLSKIAFYEISHFLRENHLKQIAKIFEDPDASENDKYVALTLLKNANTAAGGVLPMCQDTGTAIVVAKKGSLIWTDFDDEEYLSKGIYRAFKENNLRYSQLAPLSMFEEVNTKTNLPAQIDIYSSNNNEYSFLFVAKGGGSANKTFLYQATPSVIRTKQILDFLRPLIKNIGTAACPPYHLGIVIGGTSAELNMKTLKLATCKYLDELPSKGNNSGRAFRDKDMEQEVLDMTRNYGIGAQFGGKYFCHDIRVIRLPRHGASLPISIGVSCGADRQVKAKINENGVFIEKLEKNPSKYFPKVDDSKLSKNSVHIDLNQPMEKICKILSQYEVKTRVILTGTLIVARDMAHGKIKEKLDSGLEMPDYFKNYPIYYAGPAKTPDGMVTGSFGPTTAGRMDSYVKTFQEKGGSKVMLAKGNRSKQVTDSCKKNGGFYLGSIGGPGAELAQNNITKVECLEYPELGMEAIWKIEVKEFPAFIVIDDKGNDFFDSFDIS
tara:strand:- start:3993 stop:5612 length:1620 start_codon:yes stop_codon:yes gene_type:complete